MSSVSVREMGGTDVTDKLVTKPKYSLRPFSN